MSIAAIDHEPPPVQPFAALLYREEAPLATALEALEELWSPLALRGAAHPFDRTDYYAPEMGEGLQRLLVAFSVLVPPTWLVPAKHEAARLEDILRTDGKRRVNIDVGYLDLYKVVLASWKHRGHKLYLDQGVWGDLTLTFAKGAYRPLEWTFPDFRTGLYDTELHAMREAYKAQLREEE